jgi:hypothetical protein
MGCETTGGLAFFAATPPPVASATNNCGEVLKPTATDVDVEIESVRRGSRGGSLVLRLHNDSADKALMLDWSKISVRLGNGQFRRPMTDDEFLQLALEFTFPAYGWSQEALKRELPDLVYPQRGEVRRLKPGEELAIMLHFGAPGEEATLLLSLEQALTWETADGTRPVAVLPAVRCAVNLPSLTDGKPPTWWPGWVHVGVFATNGI